MVTTRSPRLFGKGDQSRTVTWATFLAQRHVVTIVAPASTLPSEGFGGAAVNVHAVKLSWWDRLRGAGRAATNGRPLQAGWMAPMRLQRAVTTLSESHDVVLVMTARAWVSGLSIPVVIDHVDALSLNMSRRATGPESLAIRVFARVEARRFRLLEQAVAAAAQGQLVTSSEDARYLPAVPAVVVVPVTLDPSVTRAGFDSSDRPFDIVLSGNMAYPPNRRAAERLAHGILPLVRQSHPVRAVVVGRGAGDLKLSGVELLGDVEDMFAVLRRARVSVVPLEIGTGTPFKLLEAAACGSALVTSSWATNALPVPARNAETDAEFANAILELLNDEHARSTLARSAHAALAAWETPAVAAHVERALITAASQRGPRR